MVYARANEVVRRGGHNCPNICCRALLRDKQMLKSLLVLVPQSILGLSFYSAWCHGKDRSLVAEGERTSYSKAVTHGANN